MPVARQSSYTPCTHVRAMVCADMLAEESQSELTGSNTQCSQDQARPANPVTAVGAQCSAQARTVEQFTGACTLSRNCLRRIAMTCASEPARSGCAACALARAAALRAPQPRPSCTPPASASACCRSISLLLFLTQRECFPARWNSLPLARSAQLSGHLCFCTASVSVRQARGTTAFCALVRCL